MTGKCFRFMREAEKLPEVYMRDALYQEVMVYPVLPVPVSFPKIICGMRPEFNR